MSTRTFLSLQELLVRLGGSLASPCERGQCRVGAREQVVVDLAAALAVEVPGAEVVGGTAGPCGTRRSCDFATGG